LEAICLRIRIEEFFEGFISSTLRDGALFHNLAYISGESDLIFVTVLSQMYPWTEATNVRSADTNRYDPLTTGLKFGERRTVLFTCRTQSLE